MCYTEENLTVCSKSEFCHGLIYSAEASDIKSFWLTIVNNKGESRTGLNQNKLTPVEKFSVPLQSFKKNCS